MKRPLLISILVHGLIITLLFFIPPPATIYSGSGVQSVSIRIRNSFNPKPPRRKVKPVQKSSVLSPPSAPEKAFPSVPSSVVRKTSKSTETDIFSGNAALISRVPVEQNRVFRDAPSDAEFQSSDEKRVVSPLAGMEEFLSITEGQKKGNRAQFSLFWIDGVQRGIISYPDFSDNPFPKTTDRLVDVPVRIKVSPQGEVSEVVIEPPGTGDVKIDRYVTSKILEIVFEPRLADMEEESGVIKLIFRDGEQ